MFVRLCMFYFFWLLVTVVAYHFVSYNCFIFFDVADVCQLRGATHSPSTRKVMFGITMN